MGRMRQTGLWTIAHCNCYGTIFANDREKQGQEQRICGEEPVKPRFLPQRPLELFSGLVRDHERRIDGTNAHVLLRERHLDFLFTEHAEDFHEEVAFQ